MNESAVLRKGRPQLSVNEHKVRIPQTYSTLLALRRVFDPGFDGAILSLDWKDALWARFFTAAHDDRGGPSSDTKWSREPESAGEALRDHQKTVRKWKGRTNVADCPTGPKEAKSTVLSIEDEAIVVAFRQHTLLPLDDCLYSR